MTPPHGAETRTAPDFRSPRNKRLGRENYEEKARRLLAEARLNVTRVDREADVYEAKVRGDSAEVYAVEWLRDSARWFCPCEARGICSHIRAFQLIVVRGISGMSAGGDG